MKRMTIWFVLSIKRWLRHPGFTALLLIMPVVLWGIHRLEPEETSRIRIGVVSEDGGLGTEVVKDLVEMGKAGSMFEFVPYATEEELKKEVQTKAAECGYLFPEGFEEKLEQGRYKRSITVYTAPSTILDPLVGEVVFSALAARYDGMIFEDYVTGTEQGNQEQPGEKLGKEALYWYQTYLENGSTFGFEYGTLTDETDQQVRSSLAKKETFPVRGMIGIFVFLSAFFAACIVKEDEKRGLFSAIPYGERMLCKIGALAAPVLLASVSGLSGLWMTGGLESIALEIGALALCGAASVLYAGALCAAAPSPKAIAMIIPALALGLFLVCPVFIDAEKWLDLVGVIRRILPPAWYLKLF